ncbi:alpha/beta hydrolase [Pollutimonas harenae]|uniref:Alpha/beta hydrolase n=1 Tax=Pollutimonas harenae TaxID=657015 RepID=A0A853GVC6_9BURK|nr:alpha/beta hydrolase [Pollutimonas harenae]NYT84736.1 alpha/beta hydrolase [Pollutimonas harenae]TEA72863.1 alpha/beta hydrolase [Pollutimonas harenae]
MFAPDANPMAYTVEEIDRQYNARASVPDCLPFLQEYVDSSVVARQQVHGELSVPYGSHQDETLDIFPAALAGAPVFVFIHGGYWRALSKDDSSFMAPAFTAAGATVVTVNYSLAPAVTLPHIVDQCRRALAWVYKHIDRYHGDASRIHVSGSSAGGHLAGMLVARGWQAALDVPDDIVHSASPISGLFDLRPLLHTHINAWAQLDAQLAQSMSPIFHLPRQGGCPLLVAWGEHETDEFKRQSQMYASAWRDQEYPVRVLEVPGANHFNILMDLQDSHSALSGSILELMGL